MDKQKKRAIQAIVSAYVSAFAEGLMSRYRDDVDKPDGVINMKKNNCFIAELGEEFMFYSAFVRSFDSSFGNILEKMGNEIAKLSYEGNDEVHKCKKEIVWHFLKPDELLMNKDYWNFVCYDKDGYKVFFEQYKKSKATVFNELKNILIYRNKCA